MKKLVITMGAALILVGCVLAALIPSTSNRGPIWYEYHNPTQPTIIINSKGYVEYPGIPVYGCGIPLTN